MQKFIARQPIFDSQRMVYGYEMLFRGGPENYFNATNADMASTTLVDNLLLFGLDKLASGRKTFLNCSADLLKRSYITLLPKDMVVLEILENIRPDEEIIAACRELKQAGYVLALDDFVDVPEVRDLLPLADFMKVDLLSTGLEEQQRLAREFGRIGIRLIAEKVESQDVYQKSREMGYSYFQGYFFQKPQMLARRDIPAYKLNYLRVLQTANQPQINLHEIGEQIKQEASLSYRLLRYLNSAAFALVTEINSIPHALSLLGEHGIRKWVSLVCVAAMADDKPAELISVPLIRARFCELLAPHAQMRREANDLFLMGLLSAMDAILDMRMADILADIAVKEEIKSALLGRSNPFRNIFEIAVNYETGVWEEVSDFAARVKMDENVIPDLFSKALEWAKQVLHGDPVAEPT